MPYTITNGIRTYFEDDTTGGDDPVPLVLLHGFTGSMGQWVAARPLLTDEHRVVVYDLRGHGRSDAPEDESSYSIQAYAEDLRALLDHLGVQHAHILGSSFGGMVALEFAFAYPERCATLILSDTSAGPRCTELSEAIAQREDGIDQQLAFARVQGKDALVAHELANNPLLRDDPRAAERFHQRWANLSLHGFLGAGRARSQRPDHHHELAQLTMPVLVIAGDLDVLVPAAEYLAHHIPHASLRLINHARHPAVADQPQGFVAVVRAFLSGLNA